MDVTEAGDRATAVLSEVSSAVVVDEEVLRMILTGVVSRGHVLLEDVPGTGKTLTARSFATTLGLSFNRIQFTPDLLPTDITGTYVFNEKTREFEFSSGPIFANVILADEINRASPKTQAALLEAMEEGQVTMEGETHDLPEPFFVIATQNPVESGEGTFPLPEAQKDRFLVKTSLGYPPKPGERELLDRRDARDDQTPSAERVLTTAAVREWQQVPERITVHDDLKDYIVEVVRETRMDPRVEVGISPRGCQRLFEVARGYASLQGRTYVTPDDVKAVADPVLAHRIVLTPDATIDQTTSSDVVDDVLDEVPVPSVGYE
ncbi:MULTISPECIES: AAA family ATPase [Haloarcula]|uniref:ATPase AAA n=1 Tax=Haloarcula pellucida TaxID=1427151 RepID=A0A830GP05_9EURY|nr:MULTISPECIES: MoxR family ATPase [Halomicroarcula]MBX0349730.1 MoxR family ATPase [Halomicroarcula pellucida]MDS0279878.1 MoxR family ATPase [Halomicroarcula sp. S1AR25-4]GGN94033.1 ATPase AAA [Halomicroarcula pellucida]